MSEYLSWKLLWNQALYEGERIQNPHKMDHFMDAESVRKPLKSYSLTTTNTIPMNLPQVCNFIKLFFWQKLGV